MKKIIFGFILHAEKEDDTEEQYTTYTVLLSNNTRMDVFQKLNPGVGPEAKF